jgi:hypothetical protein
MSTRNVLPQPSETSLHEFRSDRPSSRLTVAAVIRIAVLTLLAALSSPQPAAAHHSGSEYESSQKVEIEGTLVALTWQNPHVHLTVRTRAEPGGQQVTWDIEANSLSVLRRTNATPEKLHIGDKVRVAGQPSARAPNRIFATGSSTASSLRPRVIDVLLRIARCRDRRLYLSASFRTSP